MNYLAYKTIRGGAIGGLVSSIIAGILSIAGILIFLNQVDELSFVFVAFIGILNMAVMGMIGIITGCFLGANKAYENLTAQAEEEKKANG